MAWPVPCSSTRTTSTTTAASSSSRPSGRSRSSSPPTAAAGCSCRGSSSSTHTRTRRCRRSRTTTSTPATRHPMEALRELLDALGVRGALGADSDGYPWVFGYRGPGLGEWTHVAGRGRGSDGDQERSRDRAAARELHVGQPRAHAAPAVHASGRDGDRGRAASVERGDVGDAGRDRSALPGAEPVVDGAVGHLPRPDRPQCCDPARARRTTSSSRRATCSSPGRRRRCGATTRSSSERW